LASSPLTQGFGCFAAFTLGFAIPRFQRWELLFSYNVLTLTSVCTCIVSLKIRRASLLIFQTNIAILIGYFNKFVIVFNSLQARFLIAELAVFALPAFLRRAQ
jgi:hypothetical protein